MNIHIVADADGVPTTAFLVEEEASEFAFAVTGSMYTLPIMCYRADNTLGETPK